MSTERGSGVGRIVNFPGQGKDQGPVDLLKVALPIVVGLAWQLYMRRSAGAEDRAKQSVEVVKDKAAKGAEVVKAKPAKGAAKVKAEAKPRRSARYYAITALIVAVENPATRKVVVNALKLVRHFV